jgi:putative methionine-R-sulfoxide reductase with GAF domain
MTQPMGLLGRVQLQQEFNQAKLRAEKLEALHNIGTAITSALDLEEVLTRIAEAAVFITNAEEGSLLLLDEKSKELYLRAQKGLKDRHAHGFRIRTVDSIAGEVIEAGKPQRLTSAERALKVVTGYFVSSILYVPVAIKTRVIGVLAVDNQTPDRAFTEDDEHLLQILAGYAAIALENARLREELEQQAQTLTALYAIGQGEPARQLDPGAAAVVLAPDPESSAAQVLTPRYLETVITPYLSAMADVQRIVDEIEGKPPSEARILAISQGSPVPVGVEGVERAVEVIREMVVPWKQERAEALAQLVEKEREATMEEAWAEILEARARAALDQEEREKLVAQAGNQRTEAGKKESEGGPLRSDLKQAKVQLAFDIVARLAPDLAEEAKIVQVVRLLPGLETILSSSLQLSTIEVTAPS